jgi:hypothetical protein
VTRITRSVPWSWWLVVQSLPETEMEDMEACSSGKWDENDLLILRDTPCRSYLRTR